MTFVLPEGHNTYVPVALASDQLAVDFSRNPARFKVMEYTQLIPVDKSQGYYLYLDPDEAARVVSGTLDEFVWPDSADAPDYRNGTQEFAFKPYLTSRYAFPAVLGHKAVQQASWDIVAKHAGSAASKAMTARTVLAANALLTSSNYTASHIIDATATAGAWSTSTSSDSYIQKVLNAAAEKILDDTLGAVTKDDLVLVMGTGIATKIASSGEITELIKYMAGYDWLKGSTQRTNVSYGIPDSLYGYKTVVDETRRVKNHKNGTRDVVSVFPSDKAVLLARPGGIEGFANSVNFSSLCLFAFEEMTTEIKEDVDNRLTKIRVVEDYDIKLTSPASAVLITNIT